jgi:6-phosphofructokinase 1
MDKPTAADLAIKTLGPATIPSPLNLSKVPGDRIPDYVPDGVLVALDVEFRGDERPSPEPRLGFEKAGPREWIFFDPPKTRAAIVTCGGLCPGTNNVIRSLVLELHHKYGVTDVIGFRYGYQGLAHADTITPMVLTPDAVASIHRLGGTVLGSSRGSGSISCSPSAATGRCAARTRSPWSSSGAACGSR